MGQVQQSYQAGGGSYAASGAAVVNNYAQDWSTGQNTVVVPVGSPGWRAPVGSRLDPNGVIGSRQVGMSGEDPILEYTEDVGGARLTTRCALPANALKQSSLGDTYRIALPFYDAMTSSSGDRYCSPTHWPTNGAAYDGSLVPPASSSASASSSALPAQAPPEAWGMGASLVGIQSLYQSGGGSYLATGAALAKNYSVENGSPIAIGSSKWRTADGTRVNPGGTLGVSELGFSGSDRLLEVTQDVGGVRLTTTCVAPGSAQDRENLGNTYRVALPFFQQARNAAGKSYCEPSYW